jgi:hypothetical protein
MAALYESVFSWGQRRNAETAGLVRVALADLPLITRQSFTWLSAAAPALRELSCSGCARVQLDRAVPELDNLTRLTHLSLGPSATHAKYADSGGEALAEALLVHMPRLRSLRLEDVRGLVDADLAALVGAGQVLDTLCLKGLVDVGTATIEVRPPSLILPPFFLPTPLLQSGHLQPAA